MLPIHLPAAFLATLLLVGPLRAQSVEVDGEDHWLAGGHSGIPAVSNRDRLGSSVAPLGDLNGDGYLDFALGAPGDDDGGRDRGAVWIRFGGPNPSATKLSDLVGNFNGTLFDGDRFGFSLANVGDLDGDGRDELAVGQPGRTDTGAGWPMAAATNIGGGIPGGFEPSGCAWHPGIERLVVVDDGGLLALLTADGQVTGLFVVGGDLEAVCVSDPSSTIVHVGREEPAEVVAFDLSTGSIVGVSYDLTPWMNGNGQGLEAMTFGEGIFYAGLQRTGEIFRFAFGVNGAVTHLGTMPPISGRDDISGLHYSPESGLLYAIYDPDDILVEFTPAGILRRARLLPAGEQEGLALLPHCPAPGGRLIIAEDLGPIQRYEDFPAGCDTSGELWGRGSVWILFLESDGTVRTQLRLGHGSGGMPAALSAGDAFGFSLAAAGDLDSNGTPELFVGAPHDDGGAGLWSQRGAVWSLSLNTDGSAASATRLSPGSSGIPGVLSNQSAFGAGLACPGDWDANGIGDLVVAAPGASGGGTQRGELWSLSLSSPTQALGVQRIHSSLGGGPALTDGAALGFGLSSAPSSTLGGAPALAAGSQSPSGGELWLLGLDSTGAAQEAHPIAAGSAGFTGPTAPGDSFGRSFALAGDLDGDGLPDLLVGAPGDDTSGLDEGALWRLDLKREGLGTRSCFGDGPCPCGNNAPAPGGCATSSGGVRIEASGSTSILADDLVLTVLGGPGNQFGLVFMGPSLQGPVQLGDGLRCVAAPLLRFPARASDAQGTWVEGPGMVAYGNLAFPPPNPLMVGSTWHFQGWTRDPFGGPCGNASNLSSAISLTFEP